MHAGVLPIGGQGSGATARRPDSRPVGFVAARVGDTAPVRAARAGRFPTDQAELNPCSSSAAAFRASGRRPRRRRGALQAVLSGGSRAHFGGVFVACASHRGRPRQQPGAARAPELAAIPATAAHQAARIGAKVGADPAIRGGIHTPPAAGKPLRRPPRAWNPVGGARSGRNRRQARIKGAVSGPQGGGRSVTPRPALAPLARLHGLRGLYRARSRNRSAGRACWRRSDGQGPGSVGAEGGGDRVTRGAGAGPAAGSYGSHVARTAATA